MQDDCDRLLSGSDGRGGNTAILPSLQAPLWCSGDSSSPLVRADDFASRGDRNGRLLVLEELFLRILSDQIDDTSPAMTAGQATAFGFEIGRFGGGDGDEEEEERWALVRVSLTALVDLCARREISKEHVAGGLRLISLVLRSPCSSPSRGHDSSEGSDAASADVEGDKGASEDQMMSRKLALQLS